MITERRSREDVDRLTDALAHTIPAVTGAFVSDSETLAPVADAPIAPGRAPDRHRSEAAPAP
jgi:hypothetical protein